MVGLANGWLARTKAAVTTPAIILESVKAHLQKPKLASFTASFPMTRSCQGTSPIEITALLLEDFLDRNPPFRDRSIED
jgi:hypothetical protein